MLRSLLVFSFLLFPIFHSQAAVVINEVAWMGGVDSANDEWIELHNTGATQSVEGWTLSDGMGLEIVLAGSIAAGQYAILERTDDSSAPGSAFLIYTGSLANTGRTLVLTKADGSIADQVAGGEDWEQIGGDNTTKETAQYTPQGWITATPTPGAENQTVEITETNTSVSEDSVIANGGSGVVPRELSSEYVSLSLPESSLLLSIHAPAQAQVNQPVSFDVTPTGLGKTLIHSLDYRWNFGNINTAEQKEVTVSYSHPGTYVVVVEASYVHHEARARHEIVVLPATVSMAITESGDILIHNNAKYEIDLSGYRLQGVDSVEFPPLSYLAADATLTVDRTQVGTQAKQLIMLYDATDTVVATLDLTTHAPVSVPTQHIAAVPTHVQAGSHVVTPVVTGAAVPQGQITATSISRPAFVIATPTAAQNIAAAQTQAPFIPADRLPYLGLMSLMLVGILALYAKGTQQG